MWRHSQRAACGPNNLFNLAPLSRDTANHDYSLLPCSPLINAGSNARLRVCLPTSRVIHASLKAQWTSALTRPRHSHLHPRRSSLPVSARPMAASASCPSTAASRWRIPGRPMRATAQELNGLPPGNYLVTVTDGSGRQILDTVVVASAPQPSLALASTDVQCGTTAGGSLSASVTSGTAPFQYHWLPSASDTSLLAQQQPGDYALTVIDANGCQDSASASIALLGMLTIMVDGKTISCYNAANGWLSASPVTGQPLLLGLAGLGWHGFDCSAAWPRHVCGHGH